MRKRKAPRGADGARDLQLCGTLPMKAASHLHEIATGGGTRGGWTYIGFFKRRRGTRFAHLDTLLYSPLALGLGVGTAIVAACRSD